MRSHTIARGTVKVLNSLPTPNNPYVRGKNPKLRQKVLYTIPTTCAKRVWVVHELRWGRGIVMWHPVYYFTSFQGSGILYMTNKLNLLFKKFDLTGPWRSSWTWARLCCLEAARPSDRSHTWFCLLQRRQRFWTWTVVRDGTATEKEKFVFSNMLLHTKKWLKDCH